MSSAAGPVHSSVKNKQGSSTDLMHVVVKDYVPIYATSSFVAADAERHM